MSFLFIYNLFTPFVLFTLRCTAIFSKKLRSTINVRRGVLERWQKNLGAKSKKRILFHVASVGEFEQVRPVMEKWAINRNEELVLSFFSPSLLPTYQKGLPVVYADFLPFDVHIDMIKFYDIVQPDLVILNRYDVWPNFMMEADKRNIPVALINASVPPQGFFGKCGLQLRSFLFTKIKIWTFVDTVAVGAWQGCMSAQAASLVAGNTRVDRALARSRGISAKASVLQNLKASWEFQPEQTIVAGSTWEPDEELLLRTFSWLKTGYSMKQLKLIIVPHEPTTKRIQFLKKICEQRSLNYFVYSELQKKREGYNNGEGLKETVDVAIIDVVGVLAELYSLGATSYVGGGFGRSVHSVLEPAAHGLPIAFGPRYSRMPEACTLLDMGGAFAVKKKSSYVFLGNWFRTTMGIKVPNAEPQRAVKKFIGDQAGAAERVADFLVEQFCRSNERSKGGDNEVRF